MYANHGQSPVVRVAKVLKHIPRWLCAKVDQKRVCSLKKHYYLYKHKAHFMDTKQMNAKIGHLPYLALVFPLNSGKIFYDPEYLCKVSTYQAIVKGAGVSITTQALYERCRAGTIPCIYVDDTPLIVLARPLGFMLDKAKFIKDAVYVDNRTYYPDKSDDDLFEECMADERVLQVVSGFFVPVKY